MTQQTMAGQARLARTDDYAPALPAYAVRVTGALLALGIAAVHVADQGGLTAFTSPDWLGWSYRLIEAGGMATAIALLVPPRITRAAVPGWLAWAAAALLAAGPFLGYLASRTIGVPQDPGDIGNWADWAGTTSLLIEAALIALSIAMLRAGRLAAYRAR